MSDKNNKFDMNSIMSSLKSMINPEMDTPEPVDSDELGNRMKDISTRLQTLAKQHAKQTQILYELNHLVNGVYSDLEQLRGQDAAPKEPDDVPKPETEFSPESSADDKSDAGADDKDKQ